MSPAGFVSGVDEAPAVLVAALVEEPDEPDEPPPQAPRMAVTARMPPAHRGIRRTRIMTALRSARQ
jgi:hypothetical protein